MDWRGRLWHRLANLLGLQHHHVPAGIDPETGWAYCRCGARARLHGGTIGWERP